MITVIAQSTSERKAETKALYEKCLPYLNKGYSLYTAVQQVDTRQPNNTRNGWYRDLIDYAESQGYDYWGNRYKRGQKE